MKVNEDKYSKLPHLARHAIQVKLGILEDAGKQLATAHSEERKGCFVTLWIKSTGALRGCIGHLEPIRENLIAEVEECAVLAAFRDPRFPPLQKQELDDLKIEISVLSEPVAVADVTTLDVKRFGIIVEGEGRRGTLLPDIEGIETVDQQIEIAKKKAGIPHGVPFQLKAYEVIKVVEAAP